jgi:hypothetical protein
MTIQKSTHYKLVKDGIIIAIGSQKLMHRELKKQGGRVHLDFSNKRVGEAL